jgi:asparagine synthase (glutamine-hydrolysing)
MAHSLESRFPFLGHEFARFGVNLPGRFKLRKTLRVHDRRHPFIVDKWVIRALAERHVPKVLADRRKLGFPVSLHNRLRIRREFFRGGFVEDYFGLGSRAFSELENGTSIQWWNRLMLMDVWGRLFVSGQAVDQVSSGLLSHVQISPALG